MREARAASHRDQLMQIVPEADLITVPDGRALQLWRWPYETDRPTLHWTHATSFSARTYAPLLEPLSRHCNVIALDLRGHGGSAAAAHGLHLRSWQTYYADLCHVLADVQEPVWLGGHSLGGMVSLAAAVRHPQRVRGLLLLDPTILDRRRAWRVRLLRLTGAMRRSRYIRTTLGRRQRFTSREVALQMLSRQSGFKRWPAPWLRAYVDSGFNAVEKTGVTLACSPAWEAQTYAAVELQPYRYLRALAQAPDVEVHALAAARASTFLPAARRVLLDARPDARIDILPGSNHYLPMLDTPEVASWLLSRLGNAD